MRNQPRTANHEPRTGDRKGFTLVELIVVISIIGVLALAVTPFVLDYVKDAKVQTATAGVKEIAKQCDLYKLKFNDYPQELADLTRDDPARGYTAPFRQNDLIDPWNEPYQYFITDNKAEIVSLGDDRQDGGEFYAKDISNLDTVEDQN